VKSQSEIQDRVRAILVAELDRRVGEAHQRLPHRCVHNHLQELDPRPRVEDEPNPSYNRLDRRYLPVVPAMGLCMLGADGPETWQGTICEDPIDAQRCPVFTPIESKDDILTNLKRDLDDFGWIQANLPELYGLLWTLDSGLFHFVLPWWKRLWFWALRIRIEPLASDFDIRRALPQAPSAAQAEAEAEPKDDDGV